MARRVSWRFSAFYFAAAVDPFHRRKFNIPGGHARLDIVSRRNKSLIRSQASTLSVIAPFSVSLSLLPKVFFAEVKLK